MHDASVMTMVVGASCDPPASDAPAEGQLVEACRDFEADPTFGAAEAPHDIVSA